MTWPADPVEEVQVVNEEEVAEDMGGAVEEDDYVELGQAGEEEQAEFE